MAGFKIARYSAPRSSACPWTTNRKFQTQFSQSRRSLFIFVQRRAVCFVSVSVFRCCVRPYERPEAPWMQKLATFTLDPKI